MKLSLHVYSLCLALTPCWFDWGSLMAQAVKNPSAMQEMQETTVHALGQEDPLEKKMAIYSGILTWEIPWTEEPEGLQSMGSQRVRHYWVYTDMLVWWASKMFRRMSVRFLTIWRKRGSWDVGKRSHQNQYFHPKRKMIWAFLLTYSGKFIFWNPKLVEESLRFLKSIAEERTLARAK